MKILYIVFVVALLVTGSEAGLSDGDKDKLISAGAPEGILNLVGFIEVSDGKTSGNSASNSVAKIYNYWVNEVFDTKYYPSGYNEIKLYENAVDGRDVALSEWDSDKYSICVAQTKTLFVIKIGIKDKLEGWSEIDNFSYSVFKEILPNKKKRSLTTLDRRRPENISSVATWLTFRNDNSVPLGDERYLWAAQLSSPQLKAQLPEYDLEWFEVIGCWNDGEVMVIYFEKPVRSDRIITRADFKAESDQGWFSKIKKKEDIKGASHQE